MRARLCARNASTPFRSLGYSVRLLANENFPGPAIRELRERGHDVASVKETMRGAEDREVLARAQEEERIVVTFDKDFGELAYRFSLPAACGVVLFRLSGASPDVDNQRAVNALESGIDWAGNFAVITDDRIRVRPLPEPKPTKSGR
jgi:predicted nuclease of predicted toxin-antitoxin system